MPYNLPDIFNSISPALSDPAIGAASITPSDSTVFATPFRGIYVGTATAGSALAVQFIDGSTATFNNVSQGVIYSFVVNKVLATGTANISGLIGLR